MLLALDAYYFIKNNPKVKEIIEEENNNDKG